MQTTSKVREWKLRSASSISSRIALVFFFGFFLPRSSSSFSLIDRRSRNDNLLSRTQFSQSGGCAHVCVRASACAIDASDKEQKDMIIIDCNRRWSVIANFVSNFWRSARLPIAAIDIAVITIEYASACVCVCVGWRAMIYCKQKPIVGNDTATGLMCHGRCKCTLTFSLSTIREIRPQL